MDDDFGEIKGTIDISKGITAGDPLTFLQGLATFFGFETNATHVQRLVAHDYENFVFDAVLNLGKRFSLLEGRFFKLEWTVDEMLSEHRKEIVHLQSLFTKWEERLGSLGARPSDLAAVLDAGFRLWKNNADAQKRRLLGNALRNAFDPERYEEGLTLRLLGILSSLDYGDIHTLRLAGENEQYSRSLISAPPEDDKLALPFKPAESGTLLDDHYKRLATYGLLKVRQYRFTNVRGGSTDFSAVTPSELGQRLLALIADQRAADKDGAP